jgi:glutamate--cysteine ligase regulatory subunit
MYHEGQVSTLGASEFGILRLQAFLPHVNVPPAIDQINLRDCCDVPHDLLEFAKQEGIKLMPHMDEDNPLPKETLQEVLCDLGVSEKVVDMRWVVKYTAIVEERGVVDNKG